MANPRRNSYSLNNYQLPISGVINVNGNASAHTQATFSSLKLFLKKPHAFPFVLSIFLFLTWVSFRFQRHSSSFSQSSDPYVHHHQQQSTHDHNHNANIVIFSSSLIAKDSRGWLLNPISFALDSSISGGAVTCASVHLGEIRPGGIRGNHRHHTCNETFIIWGAKTLFRLENVGMEKGYAETIVGANEVAVAASPSGTAHALVNIDPLQTTFFLGCQDSVINYNSSTSDFNVWKDLR